MTRTQHDSLVARNVRALLQEARWIEADLAKRTGLCSRTVASVVAGRHARRDTLNKIALAFGLGLSEPYYPCRVLRTHTPDQVVLLYRTLHQRRTVKVLKSLRRMFFQAFWPVA